MRKTLLLLFSILVTLSAKAQLFKTYSPGYYYDVDGKKVTGVMSFTPTDDRFFSSRIWAEVRKK